MSGLVPREANTSAPGEWSVSKAAIEVARKFAYEQEYGAAALALGIAWPQLDALSGAMEILAEAAQASRMTTADALEFVRLLFGEDPNHWVERSLKLGAHEYPDALDIVRTIAMSAQDMFDELKTASLAPGTVSEYCRDVARLADAVRPADHFGWMSSITGADPDQRHVLASFLLAHQGVPALWPF